MPTFTSREAFDQSPLIAKYDKATRDYLARRYYLDEAKAFGTDPEAMAKRAEFLQGWGVAEPGKVDVGEDVLASAGSGAIKTLPVQAAVAAYNLGRRAFGKEPLNTADYEYEPQTNAGRVAGLATNLLGESIVPAGVFLKGGRALGATADLAKMLGISLKGERIALTGAAGAGQGAARSALSDVNAQRPVSPGRMAIGAGVEGATAAGSSAALTAAAPLLGKIPGLFGKKTAKPAAPKAAPGGAKPPPPPPGSSGIRGAFQEGNTWYHDSPAHTKPTDPPPGADPGGHWSWTNNRGQWQWWEAKKAGAKGGGSPGGRPGGASGGTGQPPPGGPGASQQSPPGGQQPPGGGSAGAGSQPPPGGGNQPPPGGSSSGPKPPPGGSGTGSQPPPGAGAGNQPPPGGGQAPPGGSGSSNQAYRKSFHWFHPNGQANPPTEPPPGKTDADGAWAWAKTGKWWWRPKDFRAYGQDPKPPGGSSGSSSGTGSSSGSSQTPPGGSSGSSGTGSGSSAGSFWARHRDAARAARKSEFRDPTGQTRPDWTPAGQSASEGDWDYSSQYTKWFWKPKPSNASSGGQGSSSSSSSGTPDPWKIPGGGKRGTLSWMKAQGMNPALMFLTITKDKGWASYMKTARGAGLSAAELAQMNAFRAKILDQVKKWADAGKSRDDIIKDLAAKGALAMPFFALPKPDKSDKPKKSSASPAAQRMAKRFGVDLA